MDLLPSAAIVLLPSIPVRAERDRGPSTRPASADSSRWRSPGVLIWIFDSAPMLGDATSSDQVLGQGRVVEPARRRCGTSANCIGSAPWPRSSSVRVRSW